MVCVHSVWRHPCWFWEDEGNTASGAARHTHTHTGRLARHSPSMAVTQCTSKLGNIEWFQGKTEKQRVNMPPRRTAANSYHPATPLFVCCFALLQHDRFFVLTIYWFIACKPTWSSVKLLILYTQKTLCPFFRLGGKKSWKMIGWWWWCFKGILATLYF